ncbi:MAG: winged helix-turn-helix domain-containing protein [Rubrivivax sp.]|nr:winged helix-turn-helix domain-containing protein [Rubrivivax sp.]
MPLPVAAAGEPSLPGPADGFRGGQAHLVTAEGPAAAQAWARALAAEGLAVHLREGDETADDDTTTPIVFFAGGTLAPHLARLRALHERHVRRPLMAVVRGLRDLDQVLALEMGADDIVDAALAAPVVAARLRALARRAATLASAAAPEREPPRELRFGALRLLRLEREVRLADQPVPLTEGEFEVLWLLASHAGQALSRREILKRVRGLDDQPLDRSIDSRVYRIRAKLGDNRAATPRIRTVRHQGYAFSPVGW